MPCRQGIEFEFCGGQFVEDDDTVLGKVRGYISNRSMQGQFHDVVNSVSKSGPVRSFALFLVQPDPDRSFYFFHFGQPDQNRYGPVANGCQ